ncbi:MAG: transcriptional regulator [Proteobacteria bacterium]|nr:MAG: transcriptional regulator [Pseudomonadota bacterium]RYZ72172.1 MAG: transcriptional regulator [Pseudomonadota bacterium]
MSSNSSEAKMLDKKVESTIEMITRKPLFDETCIFSIAARHLGDKWTLIILVALMERTKRYGELQAQIPTISPKMLVQTLKKLEQLELVERKIFPEVPPRVEYKLSKFGKELRPMISLLCEWSIDNEKKLRKLEA